MSEVLQASAFPGSNRFAHLRPTAVFESYWRFAAERQAIFFRRLAGNAAPWTDDPILAHHKFTNAYRAADRVSQFLIGEVIYGHGRSEAPQEILFRILLFKLFNKIETWQLLERKIGSLNWSSFDAKTYDDVLSDAMSRGTRLYSAAYIIPPVKWEASDGIKHRGHLHLIAQQLNSSLLTDITAAPSLEALFIRLKEISSFGDFLAFQMAIDINYSPIVDFDEDSFVVAGPGARDGIAKCFENSAEFEAGEIIALMRDRQEVEFDRLGITFQTLWGRRLKLIDCQNLFCEISKYARVAHPDITGASGRTRIKQIFRPLEAPMTVWFPPKWKLNDLLPADEPKSTGLL